MIDRTKMERARDMALEFVDRVNDAIEAEDPDCFPKIPTMHTASVRRSSMELTRLLSKMRA